MGNGIAFIASTKRKRLSFEVDVWQRKILLSIVDLTLVIASIFLYHLVLDRELTLINFLRNDTTSIAYGISLFLSLSLVFNLYDTEYINKTRKVLPLSFFIGVVFTSVYILTPVLTPYLPSHRIPIYSFVFGFTSLLIIWRVLYASVIHSTVFVKNFIILASQKYSLNHLKDIKKVIEGNEYDHGLKVVRIYSIPDDEKKAKDLSRIIDRMASQKLIDNIIILDQDQETITRRLNRTIVKVLQYGVQVKTYFKLYEEIKEALPLQLAGSHLYTILPVSKYNNNYVYLLWHKLLNIFFSIFGLILMFILIPFILTLNLFFNKGPLFYQQLRVGKGGKEIKIIKFRSMIVGAEKNGAIMSKKGDLRITSFGNILRKLRIDELPQLWLVLKGEMSLIGPRPERKIFIDELIKSIPLYDARHMIRPGITGWAQVKYDYGETVEASYKKLEYDLYYIKNRSVTLDIRIIFKTINTVIFYKGQ